MFDKTDLYDRITTFQSSARLDLILVLLSNKLTLPGSVVECKNVRTLRAGYRLFHQKGFIFKSTNALNLVNGHDKKC